MRKRKLIVHQGKHTGLGDAAFVSEKPITPPVIEITAKRSVGFTGDTQSVTSASIIREQQTAIPAIKPTPVSPPGNPSIIFFNNKILPSGDSGDHKVPEIENPLVTPHQTKTVLHDARIAIPDECIDVFLATFTQRLFQCFCDQLIVTQKNNPQLQQALRLGCFVVAICLRAILFGSQLVYALPIEMLSLITKKNYPKIDRALFVLFCAISFYQNTKNTFSASCARLLVEIISAATATAMSDIMVSSFFSCTKKNKSRRTSEHLTLTR